MRRIFALVLGMSLAGLSGPLAAQTQGAPVVAQSTPQATLPSNAPNHANVAAQQAPATVPHKSTRKAHSKADWAGSFPTVPFGQWGF